VVDVTSILGANNGTCTFTFKFMFPKVGQGTYTIKIYAAVSDASESETVPPSELRSSGSARCSPSLCGWYGTRFRILIRADGEGFLPGTSRAQTLASRITQIPADPLLSHAQQDVLSNRLS